MDDSEEPKRLSKEEKRRRKEEINRRMAELAAQAAEISAEESEEGSPRPSSPPRKRKSDVLAEASPVKHKGMWSMVPQASGQLTHNTVISRDDSLTIKPAESKKLEFSKSLVNKTKSETEIYGSSSKSSSTDHRSSRTNESSSSRAREDRHERPAPSGSRTLGDLLSNEAKSNRASSSSQGRLQTDRQKSLSTSMRDRSAAIIPKHERGSSLASGSRVKSELDRAEDLPQPSRLASSLTARRRTGDGDSDREGSEDQKPFGKRDAETLMVLEDLKTGPIEYGRDPEGMAEWTWVEPNSGINLR